MQHRNEEKDQLHDFHLSLSLDKTVDDSTDCIFNKVWHVLPFFFIRWSCRDEYFARLEHEFVAVHSLKSRFFFITLSSWFNSVTLQDELDPNHRDPRQFSRDAIQLSMQTILVEYFISDQKHLFKSISLASLIENRQVNVTYLDFQ